MCYGVLMGHLLGQGAVACSSSVSHASASWREVPHISSEGDSPLQQAGRSGRPKRLHCNSAVSCTQGTPAGLPWGMPGMGLEIEGAMQHAAHPVRHSMRAFMHGRAVERPRAGCTGAVGMVGGQGVSWRGLEHVRHGPCLVTTGVSRETPVACRVQLRGRVVRCGCSSWNIATVLTKESAC